MFIIFQLLNSTIKKMMLITLKKKKKNTQHSLSIDILEVSYIDDFE